MIECSGADALSQRAVGRGEDNKVERIKLLQQDVTYGSSFIRIRLPVRDDSIRAVVGHELMLTGGCSPLQVPGYGQCCYIEDDVQDCGDIAARNKQQQENVYVAYITKI